MFKVYKKLFAYVPERKYLVYVSILLSVLSTFAITGAYYYLYVFFDRLMVKNDLSGSAFYAWVIFGLLIAGYIVSFRVGIGLTVLTVAAAILYISMSGETQFMKRYQQALERLSAESVEYVRGIQVVKIFNADARSFYAQRRSLAWKS